MLRVGVVAFGGVLVAVQAGQVLAVAGVGQGVQVDDGLCAGVGRGQPVEDEVAADEAGAAGDKEGHGRGPDASSALIFSISSFKASYS